MSKQVQITEKLNELSKESIAILKQWIEDGGRDKFSKVEANVKEMGLLIHSADFVPDQNVIDAYHRLQKGLAQMKAKLTSNT